MDIISSGQLAAAVESFPIMLAHYALNQGRVLCRHLRQLQCPSAASAQHLTQAPCLQALHVAFTSAVLPAEQASHSNLSSLRLEVDAPFPRFATPAGLENKRKRQPVSAQQAIEEVKGNAKAKFDETIEVAINLGTNPKRGDQAVRGTAVLPYGTGKSIRIAAFAEGEDATAAKAAGADLVGGEELVARIQESGSSSLNFDKAVAVPAMMPKLSKIARILGPRGLMPNPKLGTLSTDIKEAIRLLKTGKVEFRADRGAVLHAGLGKASSSPEKLQSNLGALCSAILDVRPKGVKGSGASGYFLKAAMSSTMGPGVPVTIPSLVQSIQQHKSNRR